MLCVIVYVVLSCVDSGGDLLVTSQTHRDTDIVTEWVCTHQAAPPGSLSITSALHDTGDSAAEGGKF